ncbi:MAG: 50S ribosomal protein L3 [Candidatus Thalassarchaeaceae archaeon]|nr:50S ribosomal protein L3 [Candidatus Thalassarchaeaceae archaeon]
MGDRHRPKKGSMGFGPRKRAARPYGRVKSWPNNEADEVRVQGFAGWKAGMTHILMRDLNPGSPSAGAEVRKAVTVVEVPPMLVLAVRGYKMTPYGKQTAGEAWADAEKLSDSLPDLPRRIPERKEHDSAAHLEKLKESNLVEVRVIVATQPDKISAVGSKTPGIMEIGLTGGDTSAKLEWAAEKLGEELGIDDVFTPGSDIDVIGVTKGYGNQGVVRRFGVKLLSHKNSKRRRQIGNMGDFGTGYVRKTIRQAGQTGYHQRTEYNKRILRISNEDDDQITPAGGFLHYGELNNQYLMIQGSLPGPAKRLIRFRDAARPRSEQPSVDITYVSTASKQGV